YQTTIQDFSLFPYCPIFQDDAESGNLDWTAEPPWAITAEMSHSPTHSWTDSPGGSYSNDEDVSLYSPSFDIGDYEGVSLSYWQICDTESGWDYCQVEISTDGGVSWRLAASFDGQATEWEQVSMAIPELDGQSEGRIRFRLLTDVSYFYDGWHIDDVNLIGAGPNCLGDAVPSASFTSTSPDLLGATTVFTNTSTGGSLSYEWDFGDGTPPTGTANPSHRYESAGAYTVTLTATNNLGSDVVAASVEIMEHQLFLPLMLVIAPPDVVREIDIVRPLAKNSLSSIAVG
ncbi:MAG TPA: PKD domain-containing protein, partial [candidate division Zixibacteria bacterium]|nr:PKD domain-containing protein [candidate division Zixibacteria bacterium]